MSHDVRRSGSKVQRRSRITVLSNTLTPSVNRFFLKEDNKKGGKNTFTCVASHPKDDCIATGHEDGKIRLW